MNYFKNSLNLLTKSFSKQNQFNSILYSLDNPNTLNQFIIGSDADISGNSKAFLSLVNNSHAHFYGTLSTVLPNNTSKPLSASGYAAIRSKRLPFALFSPQYHNLSLYRYIQIKAMGDNNQYFINIQTNSIYPTHLYQHRIHFKSPGSWETINIPLRDFVLTSNGHVQPNQLNLNTEKIKTIGFSISRQDCDFSLRIASIGGYNSKKTLGDYDIITREEFLNNIKKAKQELNS